MFQPLHHGLVGDEYSAIESRDEKCEELISTFQTIIILENVHEVLDHGVEEFCHQFKSKSRLQLVQILIAIYEFLVVIVQRL